MTLNKYDSYKSCPIPCPKNMPKSTSSTFPAMGLIPCHQASLASN